MELARKMEEKKSENDKKIIKRGREALVKEKSHINYLRLLEQLDKMENQPDNNWDVESTMEQSSLSTSRVTSPPGSATEYSNAYKENTNSDDQLPAPQKKVSRGLSSDEEDVPVRDSFRRPTVSPPQLSERDTYQLNEIGKLLKELKEEEERGTASNQSSVPRVPMNPSSTSTSTSSLSSDGVVVFSDEDVEIRFDVTERSDSSSDSQRRKHLANALNAIRKERGQLDTIFESNKPIKRPGILRKSAPMPDSCATSTPLADTSTKHTKTEDYRKQVLKHYVQKLLEMKRQDVKELSVSSSSVTSSSTSTPKPIPTSIRPYRGAPTTPEGAEWSKRTDSSSSAYDSPATEQSSSKVSNASSLPLGAEASAYRRSDTGKWESNQVFTLGPLLDVYNDVYQAYNQRLRLMAEGRRSPQQTPPWQESTESSFMSLTLSATSTERSSVSRQRVSGFPADRSSFSVELSLSSSSSGNSSQPVSSVRDWEKASARSELCSSSSSSTVSGLKSSSSSSTSSQDISMPDVDEALRRLGLPSMQSVLRR